MPVAIQIGFMKVGAMQSDAGVFFGQNIQIGWDSHSKHNQAGGAASGDSNFIPSYINYVYDQDLIDCSM